RRTAPDDRAHAGPGDAVDRHVFLFQDFEDRDVRHAARTAAREGEADLGTGWRGRAAGQEEQEEAERRSPRASLVDGRAQGRGGACVVRVTALPPRRTTTETSSPGLRAVIFCLTVARLFGSASDVPRIDRMMSPPTTRSSSPIVARVVPP